MTVIYLSEENGPFVDCEPRVFAVTNLLVHVIDDLEVFRLLLLVQRLHVGRLLLTLLKEVLGCGS
jgi:hypothetical protein